MAKSPEVKVLMVRFWESAWMVSSPPDTCQVEAAAPVRFKAPEPAMSAEPMVMVPPIVVVPTYMFLHLAVEVPKS